MSSKIWPLSLLVATFCANSACKKEEAPEVEVTAERDAAPPPRDHLAPGELLEGSERAFGLLLPRGSRIDSQFPQQIIASNEAKPTDVANYVRSRVAMGTVTVGAASTMFNRVQVPARPGKELVIRVEQGGNGSGSRITFRDVTPPVIDPNLSEEERWRQAGLKGPGQISDPTHLH
ncbi:MAG TPA: hypothetical protein VGI39_05935 [Polyangiaceae bacterium]